jgi:hypothetical protein
VTACNQSPRWDPYICDNLVSGTSPLHQINLRGGGVAGNGMFESVVNSGDPTGSAQEYAYMTSGDDCSNNVNDANINTGNRYAPAQCGHDIFSLLDGANIGWRAYAEDFANNVSCTQGFSDDYSAQGSPNLHTEYARRHVPATFYSDVSGDCLTGGATGSKVVNLPVYPSDSGNDNSSIDQVGYAFAGITFKRFSFITPDLCHDMHGSKSDCKNNSVIGDAWGLRPSTSPYPQTIAPDGCGDGNGCGPIQAGDAWLEWNLPAIQADVGSTGVVIHHVG